MSKILCPLCNGSAIRVKEKINATDIKKIYHDYYQFDVSYLFKSAEIEFCECSNCDLKFFTGSVVGDELFYNMLQKTDLYYMESKEEYDFAAGFITPSDNVLDIGCGKGAFSKKISSKFFTGLELSEGAKDIAEKEGVEILNQTIQDHAILNKEKYNVVCTFQVVEHIDCIGLAGFLKSSVDCVKKGGYLIISVPSNDSFLSKMKNCTLNLPPHHQTRWPDRTFKEIARLYNLELVELHHDSLNPRQYKEYIDVNMEHFLTFNKGIIRKDQNFFQKVYQRIPNLLGKGLRKSIIKMIKPHGHSITAVYRK